MVRVHNVGDGVQAAGHSLLAIQEVEVLKQVDHLEYSLHPLYYMHTYL